MSLFLFYDIHSELCHQSHPIKISPAVSVEVFAFFCIRLFGELLNTGLEVLTAVRLRIVVL